MHRGRRLVARGLVVVLLAAGLVGPPATSFSVLDWLGLVAADQVPGNQVGDGERGAASKPSPVVAVPESLGGPVSAARVPKPTDGKVPDWFGKSDPKSVADAEASEAAQRKASPREPQEGVPDWVRPVAGPDDVKGGGGGGSGPKGDPEVLPGGREPRVLRKGGKATVGPEVVKPVVPASGVSADAGFGVSDAQAVARAAGVESGRSSVARPAVWESFPASRFAAAQVSGANVAQVVATTTTTIIVSVPTTSVAPSTVPGSTIGASSSVAPTTVTPVGDGGGGTSTATIPQTTSTTSTVPKASSSTTSSTISSVPAAKAAGKVVSPNVRVSLGGPGHVGVPALTSSVEPKGGTKVPFGQPRKVAALVEDKTSGELVSDDGKGRVVFGATDNAKGAVRIESGTVGIGLRPLRPAKNSKPTVSGTTVTWDGAFPDGSALVEEVTSTGVKGVIVVAGPLAGDPVWDFELVLSKGLRPQFGDMSGFSDPAQLPGTSVGIFDDTGVLAGSLPAGLAIDANGASTQVEIVLREAKNRRWVMSYAIDPDWLNAPGRAFPVRVDPTITQGVGYGGPGLDKYQYYSNGTSGPEYYTFWTNDNKVVYLPPNLTGFQTGMTATLYVTNQSCYYNDPWNAPVFGAIPISLSATAGNWAPGSMSWANQPALNQIGSFNSSPTNTTVASFNVTNLALTWLAQGVTNPAFRISTVGTGNNCSIIDSYMVFDGTPNNPPTGGTMLSPANAALVSTQPTFSGSITDSDGPSANYFFQTCVPSFANCQSWIYSGWTTSNTWTPPAMGYNQPGEWEFFVSDGVNLQVGVGRRSFLTVPPPNGAPTTATVVAPAAGSTGVGTIAGSLVNVTFTGVGNDPDNAVSSLQYQFEYQQFGTATIVAVPFTAAGVQSVSVGLLPGVSYYVRVTVRDPGGLTLVSGWSSFTTVPRPNTAPSVATLLAPANSVAPALVSGPVTLSASASDAEGDAVLYQYQVCPPMGASCTTSTWTGASVTSGTTALAALNFNTVYTWSVIVKDAPPVGVGPLQQPATSAVWSFLTGPNGSNVTTPVVVGPLSGEQTSTKPFLQVTASDPNGDPVSFKYQICPLPLPPQTGTTITFPSGVTCFYSPEVSGGWQVPSFLDFGGTYYWRAWARNTGEPGLGVISTAQSLVVNRTVSDDPGVLDLGWDPYADLNIGDSVYSGMNEAIGAFVTSATDASVGSVAPGLTVQRTYNSRNRRVGPFGRGWSSMLDARSTKPPITPAAGNVVSITMPDGRGEVFTRNAAGAYVPSSDGFFGELVLNPVGWTGYRYATKDRTTAWFNSNGYITKILDRNGNTLNYTYNPVGSSKVSQITDAKSGRAITVEYNAANYVWKVKTPSVAAHGGQLVWEYTYTGNLLTQVCPPTSASPAVTGCFSYTYDGERLSKVTKPKGNVDVEVTYDSSQFVLGGWNLAPNSSFETAGSWSTTGTTAGSGIVTPGTAAPFGSKVYLTNFVGAAATGAELRSASIAVESNKPYTVSARISGSGVETVVPYVYFYDVNGVLLPDASVAAGYGNDAVWRALPGWSALRGQFRTPETARFVQIAFKANTTVGANGSVQFDGVMLEKGDGKIGRVSTRKDGLNQLTTFAYVLNGWDFEVVADDPSSNPTSKDVYNDRNQLVKRYDAGTPARLTQFEYDAKGFVNKITDPAGRITTITNDVRGNPTVRTRAWLGRSQYWTYIAGTDLVDEYRDERSASSTDPTFRVKYTYDAAGNLTSETDQANSSRVYAYAGVTDPAVGGVGATPLGALKSVTDRTGVTVNYKYDELGNQLRVEDPAKGVTVSTFDEIGRVKSVGRELAGVVTGITTIDYDVRSRVTAVTEPGIVNTVSNVTHTKRTVSTFDANGNATNVAVSDLTGADATRNVASVYDLLDRPTQLTTGAKVSATAYDVLGNVVLVTDPRLVRTRTAYNDRNLPVSVTIENYFDVVGGPTRPIVSKTTTYDPLLPLVDTETDVLGRQVKHTWRTDDLLAKREMLAYSPLTGANRNVVLGEFVYDNAGRVTSEKRGTAGSGVATVTRVIKPTGFVESETLVELGRTTSFTHDFEGRVKTKTTGNFVETMNYKATTGQLETSKTSGNSNNGTTYTYDVWGRLTGVTNPNANVTTTGYDLADRPVSVTTPVLASVFDANGGNPTAVSAVARSGYDTFGAVTHGKDPRSLVTSSSYDQYGRMSGVTYPTNGGVTPTESFTYDLADNALTATDRRARTTTNTFDAFGRTRTVTSPVPVAGQPAAVQAMAYNDASQMTSSTDAYGVPTTYTYDKLGRTRTSSLAVSVAGTGGGGPDPALVAEYHFEGNVNDSSPNANTGSLVGAATIGTGKTGSGLVLTGAGNGHGRAPQSASINSTTAAMSFSAWVKPAALTSSWNAIGSRQFGSGGDDQWFFATNGTQLSFYVNTTVGGLGGVAGGTLPVGVWSHVTATYDGVNVRIFLNGTQVAIAAKSGNLVVATTAVVLGGGANDSVPNTAQELFNGTIDDACLFNRALTSTEVATTNTCPLVGSGGSSSSTQTATTTFDYDDLGNQVLVRDPAGKDTVTASNAAGQPVNVTDATNAVTQFTYLPNTGWADTVVVAGVRRTRFEYDDAGRTIRQHAQNSAGTTNIASDEFTYDWVGNRKTHKRPNGAVDSFDFDVVNRLVKSTTDIGTTGVAATAVSEAGFDVGGNLVNVKDARSNVTTMSYNNWGLMGTLTEPSTPTFPNIADRQWTTTYDAGGLATGETRPGGVTVSRAFDGQGRLTSETGSGGSATSASRSFGFDVGSRMVSAGSQQFTYDSRGLLAGSTGPQGVSSFGFDIVGRMSTRTDASGTTSFGYNNRSDLTSVTTGGSTTGYSWLGSGELDSVLYPAGVNRKYTYDDLGRATNDVVKNSASTVLSQRQYGYNTDSTLATSIVSQAGNPASGSYTYGYDKGARLTTSTVGGVTKSFGYDAAGNRTLADGQSFVYDARNRLVSGAGTGYNWSARGTLSSSTGTGAAAYAHDGLDRLTQAGAVTYAYDSLDRVTTRTQGAATSFGYAGVETDPVSDGVATYKRSPGGNLYGVVRGGSLVLAGVDRHGDVSFTLNPTTGVIADSVVRDPWGKALGTTGTTPAVGFQGDWTDPTSGLVWMAARWYQPNTGTFTARDTYPGEVGAYATLNRYTYGLNNPLMFHDPTGRFSAGNIMQYLNGTVDSAFNFSYGDDNVFTPGSSGNAAWGNNNLLSGENNSVAGNANVVVGSFNAVTGSNVLVLGHENTVVGQGGVVIGQGNQVRGDWNFVIGNGNTVVGNRNGVFGFDETVIGSGKVKIDWGALGSIAAGQVKVSACYFWGSKNCGRHASAFMKGFGEALWGTVTGTLGSIKKCFGSEFLDCMMTETLNSVALMPAAMLGMAEQCSKKSEECARATGVVTSSVLQAVAAKKLADKFVAKVPEGEGAAKPGSAADDAVDAACSFGGETAVLMANGSVKSISLVVVGDIVVAQDPDTREVSARAVTHAWVHDDDLVRLEIDGDVVRTTEDHPFWNDTDQEWQRADQLDAGDYALTAGGRRVVVGVLDGSVGRGSAYNLTVEGLHTYHVLFGTDAVLVHNACKKDPKGEAEHTKNARPSTEAKHEAGNRRRSTDKGGEKADARRRGNPNKRKK